MNKKTARKKTAKRTAKKIAKAGTPTYTIAPDSAPASTTVPAPTNSDGFWERMNRVNTQVGAAGLAGLEAHTEAQLEQVGRIFADELGIEANSKACVTLGSAGLAFNRALKAVLAT